MSFAREGFPLIAIAALVAAGTYALALNRRSWPLWLLAFALTIVALWVSYFLGDAERASPRGQPGVTGAAESRLAMRREPTASDFPRGRARPIPFFMYESNLPADPFRASVR